MRAVRILIPLIIVYVVYSFGLTAMSHVGFPKDMQSGLPVPYLADKPVGEDGFYMLSVAWNISSGRGVVYNNNLPTTGIQPLSTAIFALLAWIVQSLGGDKWNFIRVILAFGSVNLLLFGHIVGAIVRKLTDPKVQNLGYALGFIGVVFNFTLFRLFTYGLETGIYLTLFAITILYTLLFPLKGIREAIVLGTLVGLTAWARIDFGVVFLIFLCISVLRRQLKMFWVVLTGTIATLFISPWFLYTFHVTGNWIPSSGAAQATLITMQSAPSRLWIMGKAVLTHMTPWCYSVSGWIFIVAASVSFMVLVAFVFHVRGISIFLLSRLKQHPLFTNWFIGTAVLTLIYPVFFWASHFYVRYSAPIVVPLTVIMAMTVCERIRSMSKTVWLVVLSTLPVCFFTWAFLSLHTGRIGNNHSVTAGFIQNYFDSVKVGAFQSGVIGYFNSNVINLDGKVNQSALDYVKDGRLSDYIDSENIVVIVDWPGYIKSLPADWLTTNWNICGEQIPNNCSICLQRKPPSVN